VRIPLSRAATAALVSAAAWTAVTGGVAGAAATGRGPGVPQGIARCPTGTLCVWTQPGFAGDMTEFLDDGNWAGQCRLMRSPIRSLADLTADAPWRMQIFLFHNPRSRPCDRRGVYARYAPGQHDSAVAGGPVTAVQIYAEPNPTGGQ
jgi:hypothetical protein